MPTKEQLIEHHQLVEKIIQQLSKSTGKSFERIKKLIFEKQNIGVINEFWRLLDNEAPNHNYQYIGINDCCNQFLRDVSDGLSSSKIFN